jgi:hypothetical protein
MQGTDNTHTERFQVRASRESSASMPLGGEKIKKKLFPMRGLVGRGESKTLKVNVAKARNRPIPLIFHRGKYLNDDHADGKRSC